MLALALAFLTGCNSSSVPPAGAPSRTGLLLSDIHFNPLADPALANQLAQAPASQWDSIFATSAQTAYSYSYAVPGYGTLAGDTNFPLLQSALGAMRQRVPNPDIILISGDFLVHALPLLFAKFVTNKSVAYATFVNTTEQYLALKLSQTFPNAQIVPALGDWDTPCSSSGTYPGTAFLAAFSAAWNPAVNRFGGSPDFQAAFATGGYYATAFPIDPRGRLIVLDTQPWSATYQSGCQTGAGPGTLGNVELAWLSVQLDNARSSGQRVWILGHIPPGVSGLSPTGSSGVDLDASSRAQAVTAGAACPIAPLPFYADAYSNRLYALFTQNRDLLTLGLFGHEHMDDYRVLRDSSGNPVFGMKIVPSVTPFDGNNPAFVQFSYDPAAGVISDATIWYLTNLATANATEPGVWRLEYDFDRTYGQNALDSNGVAGAVAQILAQLSAQAVFKLYYPSSSPAITLAPFFPFGCALNNLTAADYGACYCGH
jgi:sphingomyelin phosphodiesterase acid-like 3